MARVIREIAGTIAWPRSVPCGFQIRLESGARGNRPPDLVPGFLLCEAQLVGLLQIHPEFRTGSEPLTKSQHGICGDATLTVDDLGNAIGRNVQIETELMGIDPRFLEFVCENFARMNWQTCHDTTPLSDNQRSRYDSVPDHRRATRNNYAIDY